MNINTRNMDFVNFNNEEMQWVKFNNVIVYEAWKKLTASGVPPITLQKCKGVDLVDYKVYGNSLQGEIFDRKNPNLSYFFSMQGTLAILDNYRSVILECKPNTAYLISCDFNTTKRIGFYNTFPKEGITLNSYINDTTKKEIKATSGSGDNYLFLQYAVNNDLVAEEGGSGTLTTNEILDTLHVEEIPTPEEPIEIESVGDKTNNLFGGEFNKMFKLDEFISANTEIIASGNNASSQGYIALYDKNQSEIVNLRLSGLNNNRRFVEITLETDIYYVKFHNNNLGNFCLRIDGKKEYTPYGYKIPVNVIKNNINIFDKNNADTKNLFLYINNSSCVLKTVDYIRTVVVSCKPNTTYGAYTSMDTTKRIASSVDYPQKDTNIVSFVKDTKGKSISITTGMNDNYLIFQFAVNSDVTPSYGGSGQLTIQEIIDTIQIKEQSQTNIYLNEPLRKIGDYADYIDFKKQKVFRKVGLKLLNGTEDWNFIKEIGGGYCGFRLIGNFNFLRETNKGGMSNRFEYLYAWAVQSNHIYFVGSTTDSINLITNVANNLEDFKTWLASNNVITHFILNTQLEETIDLPTIPTYKGSTVIEVDTNILPSNMEVEYYGKEDKI